MALMSTAIGAMLSSGVVGPVVDCNALRTHSAETILDAELVEWPYTAAWAATGSVALAGWSPLRQEEDTQYFSAYSANCKS